MGGVYERLIGLTKQALKITLNRTKLSLKQLTTIVIEIETIINTRPLTFVSSEFSNIKIISPNDFLSLNPKQIFTLNNFGNGEDAKFLSNSNSIVESWKKGVNLCSQFWKIWSKHYLQLLKERSKGEIKQNPRNNSFRVKVDDIVLIKNNSTRALWNYGKVAKLIKSHDGLIRAAYVIMSNGKSIFKPINLLCPIETNEENHEILSCDNGNNMTFDDITSKNMPTAKIEKEPIGKRRTFIEALKKINECSK